MSIKVTIEATPNPATLKFVTTCSIVDHPVEFSNVSDSQISPLANKLFGFPWTSSVFLGQNFISVTKADWVEWNVLAEPLAGIIGEHLEKGEAILTEFKDNSGISADDTELVKKIKQTLNQEIRPVVALDGGDIIFSKVENDILYIHMKGACSGCPSSTATLKQGIEVRIRELYPNIKEVVAI